MYSPTRYDVVACRERRNDVIDASVDNGGSAVLFSDESHMYGGGRKLQGDTIK